MSATLNKMQAGTGAGQESVAPQGLMARTVSQSTSQAWWLIEMRGVTAIIFGLCAVFLTVLPLRWLVLLFAVFTATDGILCVVASCMAALRREQAGVIAFAGLAGLLIGGVAMQWAVPDAAGTTILAVVWAAASGLAFLAGAAQCACLRGRQAALLAGSACLLVASILWFGHNLPGPATIQCVGALALALGCMRLVVSSQVRGLPANARPR
jgi:uncharacterized membrane protein HdeD (DUF308 family)